MSEIFRYSPPSLPVWNAGWIWDSNPKSPNAWMCFRHAFDLPAKSETAPLWIACADKYWLWINGQRVVREGGLKSGPTRDGWYVDSLDVAEFLKAGRNHIAVVAWFWGHGGASHRDSGEGGLLFQLQTGEQCIGSDDTWRVLPHPAFGQRGGGLSVTLSEQAVDFDARRDLVGWTEPDFDASSWARATLRGVPPVAPWGELVARPIPLWRDSEPRAYENATALGLPIVGPARVTGVLPANLQVYPHFELLAEAGAEVKVHIERDYKTTLYTTRAGVQEFEVPTWGNGHNVTYELPSSVTLLDASYRETGFDCTFAGAFACSDAALTQLWQKAARTAYVCMRDTFMDCPDRERSPWPGDAANTTEVTLRTLDRRSDALVAKTFRELAGWASPDGILWGAVPTSRFGGSFREFPAQTLAVVGFGLRAYWLHSGDRSLASEFYPALRGYLLEVWQRENGLVVHRGPWEIGWGEGVQCWYDWNATGDGSNPNIDAEALDQALYAAGVSTLEMLAQANGLEEDAARCRQIRAEMRAAFDARYWSPTEGAYRSARHNGPPDERVQSLAVLTGLAPTERHAQLADQIEAVEKCSIYFERFPLEALVRLGRPQSALRRFHRRFASAIASPYSTLPEHFGREGNHAWGGAAVCLLAEALTGVEVVEEGCRRVRLSPVAGGLEWADYTLPTVRGALRCAWRREAGRWKFNLTIPPETTVEVRPGPEEDWIVRGEGIWRV